MNEEKVRILKMVEDGKITAEEAVKLLDTINGVKHGNSVSTKGKMRFLKIRVYEGDLNKPKVRVNLPISLIKIATRFIPKDKGTVTINNQKFDLKDLNIDEILDTLKEGEVGNIVEVEDGNERVEIFIE